jgi:hypothetical protein
MASMVLVTTVIWSTIPFPPTFLPLKSISLPHPSSSPGCTSPQCLFKKHTNNYSFLYLSLPTTFSQVELAYTFLLVSSIQSCRLSSSLLHSLKFNVYRGGEAFSRPSTHASTTQWNKNTRNYVRGLALPVTPVLRRLSETNAQRFC